VIAYMTPPTGVMYKLRSENSLRGYQYDGDILAIYGNFKGGQTLVLHWDFTRSREAQA